ncbi:MAG TPA: tRNA (N6-threonylcarbamoyladenosine(37)-N6)-methyltransferase TrmO [Polyangiaceae bacterium]|nr:tRNA (N6-threonylcarbamoyladenosine(37)-N6)-methyltransferase TrmO [Polyangiaceae bacterium]
MPPSPPSPPSLPPSLTVTPIGVARTPFPDRVSAPRQPFAARDVTGTIELIPGHGFEHALEDLEGFDRIWILFWFHLNQGWRPKVLPPRSAGKRRGVFSTRSPHRPNPLGLSAVRLDRIDGLTLHVRDLDLIDGTPVLDIKPYIPYADAHPSARTGWLKPLAPAADPSGAVAPPADPEPGFQIEWSPAAAEQAQWLRATHAIDLLTPVERTLALGPQPHPYRRIRALEDGMLLAVKDWRVRFHVEGRRITVDAITTGYRPRQLAAPESPAVEVHQRYVARFGGAAPGEK